jgi:hypothetical protein
MLPRTASLPPAFLHGFRITDVSCFLPSLVIALLHRPPHHLPSIVRLRSSSSMPPKSKPIKTSDGGDAPKKEEQSFTHWLMKAEPDTRIVKGKDVKVSRASRLYIVLELLEL